MRKMFSRMTAAVLSAVFLVSPLAVAQDDDDGPLSMLNTGNKPFVYVMAASANRLKEEATYMFDVAGMPESVEAIMSSIEDNLRGLEGIDWDRPAGMMMYLNGVFPPSIEVVAFLPVAEMGEFQGLMEIGNSILKEEPNDPGRYELITTRRNIQMRVENGYAFIQMPWADPDPTFDRELPSPTALVGALANQFDLGITLDVEAIPKATRSLILNVITSTMSTQMQQRDDEPDSRYEARRALSQGDIDALKLLFDECEKISVGLNVSSESQTANLDFVFDVKDGGELLQEILASSSKTSYFSPLLDDEAPISLSWSGIMAQRDIDKYSGFLDAVKPELARIIEENGEFGPVPTEGSPMFNSLTALKETISDGHVDIFGQLYRDSDEKLAVVMAMRVEDGETIARGLEDLLQRLPEIPDVGEVELAAGEHRDVTFHRLEAADAGAGWRDVFGSGVGLSVGSDARTAWLCVGGEKSFDVLKSTMDELVAAYEDPSQIRTSASAMRMVVHVGELVNTVRSAQQAGEPDEADEQSKAEEKDPRFNARERFRQRREQNREMFIEALSDGGDRVELSVRPTDTGTRMRIEFAEGFIGGIGRMIGSGVNQ